MCTLTNHPEYPKIHSPYYRDDKGKFIFNQFSCPEFEYLWDSLWVWTEKVDGTSCRVGLTIHGPGLGQTDVAILGRTSKSQMPTSLVTAISNRFHDPEMEMRVQSIFIHDMVIYPYHITLYGEGYGKGIQKVGANYRANSVDFVLFDILIGRWWLNRETVNELGAKLHIPTVPLVATTTPQSMESIVQWGDNQSAWPGAQREGVVGTPICGLLDRSGRRIIMKIKGCDYGK